MSTISVKRQINKSFLPSIINKPFPRPLQGRVQAVLAGSLDNAGHYILTDGIIYTAPSPAANLNVRGWLIPGHGTVFIPDKLDSYEFYGSVTALSYVTTYSP